MFTSYCQLHFLLSLTRKYAIGIYILENICSNSMYTRYLSKFCERNRLGIAITTELIRRNKHAEWFVGVRRNSKMNWHGGENELHRLMTCRPFPFTEKELYKIKHSITKHPTTYYLKF